MKFILTGCTGFIGSEVLSQCLKNPQITSIVALSRRELPESVTKDPKLKVLIFKDFNTYSDSALKELSGADACIWLVTPSKCNFTLDQYQLNFPRCMGTTAANKELEIDYPLAFGNAFSKTLAKTGQTFRYIHLSGALTERNPDASIWYKPAMRKYKVNAYILQASSPKSILTLVQGQAEVNMLAFASDPETKGLWKTLIVKAGFVYSSRYTIRDTVGWLIGSSKAIRKEELSGALIDVALTGWKEDTWTDNQAMVTKGREYLEAING